MRMAWATECIDDTSGLFHGTAGPTYSSVRLDHQLESRMREIRQSGSEGGGAPRGALPTPIFPEARYAGQVYRRRRLQEIDPGFSRGWYVPPERARVAGDRYGSFLEAAGPDPQRRKRSGEGPSLGPGFPKAAHWKVLRLQCFRCRGRFLRLTMTASCMPGGEAFLRHFLPSVMPEFAGVGVE